MKNARRNWCARYHHFEVAPRLSNVLFQLSCWWRVGSEFWILHVTSPDKVLTRRWHEVGKTNESMSEIILVK